MVTVKIHGAIGNQMFQYALGRALSLENNVPLRIDPSTLFDITPWHRVVVSNYALSTVFRIDPKMNYAAIFEKTIKIPYFAKAFNKYYPRMLDALGYWHYFQEKRAYIYDPSVFEKRGNIYLDGYWQSEKYFKKHEKIIRDDFSFRAPLTGEKAKLAEEIVNSESVCLNVRRQEIVNIPSFRDLYFVADESFYDNAVSLLKKRVGKNVTFYVVSDDIEWCRKNLRVDGKHVFVGNEYYGTEFRDALHLMSLCKHFIIPNSTFAWWAAWLSLNPEKVVITPKVWMTNRSDTDDLLPESWIKI